MVGSHSLQITPEVLALTSELDEFKGSWRALGRLAPERLDQLRHVATIESVGSSTRIEGSALSDREVESLLGRLGKKSFATRDEQEVAGYAMVMNAIFESHSAIPITENYVKQLHSMLLRHSSKDERHRGHYKTLPNQVEAFDADGRSIGVIFATTSPFDTPREMTELVEWFNGVESSKSLHPLLATALFVVTFLAIHPFQDGNGRLSRVLTTLLLLRAGYTHVPFSSLESIIEQSKEAYYLALRRTQLTLRSEMPEWNPWVVFFLRSLQAQKRRLEAKLDRERVIHASMPPLSTSILEFVTAHGSMSVGEIVRLTSAPRPTVKKRLRELVAAAHLRTVGRGRGTRYALP